jgi:hypothetical protein
VAKEEQRNIEIKAETWRKVGIIAAELGTTKKEIVNNALMQFWLTYKEAKN